MVEQVWIYRYYEGQVEGWERCMHARPTREACIEEIKRVLLIKLQSCIGLPRLEENAKWHFLPGFGIVLSCWGASSTDLKHGDVLECKIGDFLGWSSEGCRVVGSWQVLARVVSREKKPETVTVCGKEYQRLEEVETVKADWALVQTYHERYSIMGDIREDRPAELKLIGWVEDLELELAGGPLAGEPVVKERNLE